MNRGSSRWQAGRDRARHGVALREKDGHSMLCPYMHRKLLR